MNVRAKIVISGRVQGVFFRKEITDLAKKLKITGWVRNLPDGRVEAVAEGEKDRLEALIDFCHVGPPGASVRGVDVEWLGWAGEYHGFRILKHPPPSK